MIIIKKTSPEYILLDNYHLMDRSISLDAKGLLGLMLSLPENYSCTINELVSFFTDDIDNIESALRELEDHGYVNVLKERDSQGKLKYTFDIFERPELNKSFGNGS